MRRVLLLLSAVAVSAWGQAPMLFGFEPNTGDLPAEVRFARRTSGAPMLVTQDAVVLPDTGLRVQMVDAAAGAVPEGDSPGSTAYNFYEGRDPSRWRVHVRLFEEIRWEEIYPGVTARFSLPGTASRRGKLVLLLQPGADLGRFRVRVLYGRAVPHETAGGIQFDRQFTVDVRAYQGEGHNRVNLGTRLKLDPSGLLRVDAPARNAGSPAEVEIEFPLPGAVPVAASGDGPFRSASVRRFQRDQTCESTKTATAVARLDEEGAPIWISLLGGTCGSRSALVRSAGDGVAVSGTTTSREFPVTVNAPAAAPGSEEDVALAYFDGSSGRLRSSTYAGLDGPARLWGAVAAPGYGLSGGGEYEGRPAGGFLFRWSPEENRFAFLIRQDSPVRSVAADVKGDLYFALGGRTVKVGMADAGGNLRVAPVLIAPASRTDFAEVRLLQAAGGEVWVTFAGFNSRAPLWIARVALARGAVIFSRVVSREGEIAEFGTTPAGNYKLLVKGAPERETTTADAPLVAGGTNMQYFSILSPVGQMVHATYVPLDFPFSRASEPREAPPARVAFFANAAGRARSEYAAPGQLIVITGGGFGPVRPISFAPDQTGMYPLEAGGFRVRIGGRYVPILSVTRGLITVQVPYELDRGGSPVAVEVFEGGQALNRIPLWVSRTQLAAFEWEERDESNGRRIAALNEHGTWNSPGNPARLRSVVSIFGSGLGQVRPAPVTGGVTAFAPPESLPRRDLPLLPLLGGVHRRRARTVHGCASDQCPAQSFHACAGHHNRCPDRVGAPPAGRGRPREPDRGHGDAGADLRAVEQTGERRHRMKEIATYLTFDGNCRAAMEFYEKCLHGTLQMMPFAGAPFDFPEDAKDRVMHARLSAGPALLMASDTVPGNPFQPGNNFSVSINCESQDEADSIFAALSEGGNATMPLQNTFWGAYFGMLTDQFGVQWMVSFERPKNG